MNFPSFPFPNRYRISFVFITTYFFDIHVRYFFDNHLKKNDTSNKIIRFSTFNQERSLSILLLAIMKTQSNDKILVKVQSGWKISRQRSQSQRTRIRKRAVEDAWAQCSRGGDGVWAEISGSGITIHRKCYSRER